jgi:mono/diheme cytochrome c family protein
MYTNWTTRMICSAGVLVFAAMLFSSVQAQDKSATTFKQKCATCHGPDGKADTPAGKSMKVRSFSDPETKKMSDDELAAVIEKGKNKMPAYGKSMNADDIKALVAYIRSLAK